MRQLPGQRPAVGSQGQQQAFLSELQGRQAAREMRSNPAENDPAFRLLGKALAYLAEKGEGDEGQARHRASCPSLLLMLSAFPRPPAVPPATAPELFVSMARGPEVHRAEDVLLGRQSGSCCWGSALQALTPCPAV